MRNIAFLIVTISFIITSCHSNQVSKFNENATIHSMDTLINPQEWKVITTFTNRKNKTISILYGNEIASNYAYKNNEGNYPNGTKLALATWESVEDPNWFGAKIPGEVQSVEIVTIASNSNPVYSLYKGNNLNKVEISDTASVSKILSYRTMILPK
ncbi:cytochrome P460 family protein [Rhizosphaericola mali]|uniref:Cytochrome P460 domain-containing protein n=1 Tax=Rhizosphaericola mali TaxID=2545455 RepID=A0A5P2FWG3_9BACT|nr:cytochrome P460 family protein [Rhizosphaericola mali]QES87237.1 hypothetical protein E0W69_000695 [Rhizosphaericola mali]